MMFCSNFVQRSTKARSTSPFLPANQPVAFTAFTVASILLFTQRSHTKDFHETKQNSQHDIIKMLLLSLKVWKQIVPAQPYATSALSLRLHCCFSPEIHTGLCAKLILLKALNGPQD